MTETRDQYQQRNKPTFELTGREYVNARRDMTLWNAKEWLARFQMAEWNSSNATEKYLAYKKATTPPQAPKEKNWGICQWCAPAHTVEKEVAGAGGGVEGLMGGAGGSPTGGRKGGEVERRVAERVVGRAFVWSALGRQHTQRTVSPLHGVFYFSSSFSDKKRSFFS